MKIKIVLVNLVDVLEVIKDLQLDCLKDEKATEYDKGYRAALGHMLDDLEVEL